MENKAQNDKAFFAAAARLAVFNGGEKSIEHLESIATIASLFQHGGRPLRYISEKEYTLTLSHSQLHQMFSEGLT